MTPGILSVVPSVSAERVGDDLSVAAWRAADRRETQAVPPPGHTVAQRRAVARALSQIADTDAISRLLPMLADEDPETLHWTIYGLGLACEREDRVERARLVAAAVSRWTTLASDLRVQDKLEPVTKAMAWMFGRCGGVAAQREMARWLTLGNVPAREASFALMMLAVQSHGLEDDVAAALVAAAESGKDEALAPFTRGDWSSRAPTPRLAEVAVLALSREKRPQNGVLFAVRVLGKYPSIASRAELARLVEDTTAPVSDRIEALRSLAKHPVELGDGFAAVASFATRRLPSASPKPTEVPYGMLTVALELLARSASNPTRDSSLRAFATMPTAPADRVVARRWIRLKCIAASALDGLKARGCDASLSTDPKAVAEFAVIRDEARLDAMDQTRLDDTAAAWVTSLAKSSNSRLAAHALSVIGKHTEIDDITDVLVKALASPSVGVIATAADVISARKDLNKETKAPLLVALGKTLGRPFEESDAEVKIALAKAIETTSFVNGQKFLETMCQDPIALVRKVANDALHVLAIDGHSECGKFAAFSGTSSWDTVVKLADKSVGKVLKLDSDVGLLTITLSSAVSPIAAVRVVELARSGFYDGLSFHRLVPGFVAQLGDPAGDGFGGAHTRLRCETAPVAFQRFDVGVAIAGRDTGSSQIFVTLARAPHLDGAYSHLGHAEGPWDELVEGDVLRSVRVE